MIKMVCMFYSAHCMNIIFNSLLAQFVKYDVCSSLNMTFIQLAK